MSADPSAYEALGLAPGADQPAIERAYRELIKRYHPDREGGDPARAAEINRAYHLLRQSPPQAPERAPTIDLSEALYARRMRRKRSPRPSRRSDRRRRRLRLLALLAAGVGGLVYWQRALLVTPLMEGSELEVRDPSAAREGQASSAGSDLLFGGPLNRLSIDAAVERAAILAQSKDGRALVQESESCHQRFRETPTLAGLDACAGFDDAVLEIENRRSVGEQGRFEASALTARQIAAAKLLSADYQAIEARLDRVRSHVRTALAGTQAGGGESGVAQPAPRTTGGLPPLVSSADRPAAH